MTMEVRRFAPSLSDDWASVLHHSRNGVFLFERDYMEYHSDRFTDFSAVAYFEGSPVAILPASIDMSTGHAYSHAGLTFGGVVVTKELRGDISISAVHAILDALKTWGANRLTLKLLPPVFASYPSSEIDYALWLRNFSLVRKDLSSVLPLEDRLDFNRLKIRSAAKAKKMGVFVSNGEVAAFHRMLSSVLNSQHGVAPVHSLLDLQLLISRFPDKIVLRSAVLKDEVIAGTLVFKYGHVWHTQYLANSDEGRKMGALDLVISSLIVEATEVGAKYLSFGISTDDSGRSLNTGLLWQKESYGARSIVHDFLSGQL